MATVSFDSHTFKVLVGGEGRLPPVTTDENGMETYSVPIIITSKTIQTALYALISKVTIQPAMAGGGIFVVERGPGARHLIYPIGNDETVERHAILTGFDPEAWSFQDGDRRGTATWLLGTIIP